MQKAKGFLNFLLKVVYDITVVRLFMTEELVDVLMC